MRVFKCFINFDKEEKWLNDMAKRGYELESAAFGYKFHTTKPEDTVIRIDYRTFKNKEAFIDYCTLFEDSGWRHIAGTKYSGSQYFKKVGRNNDNDIFSDVSSKAGKYKRLSNMWLTLAIPSLLYFIVLIYNKAISLQAILNPKLLYLTPGLWERTGTSFWRGFLFETPFAIMRGFFWLFFLGLTTFYIYFSFKARSLYNKQKESI